MMRLRWLTRNQSRRICNDLVKRLELDVSVNGLDVSNRFALSIDGVGAVAEGRRGFYTKHLVTILWEPLLKSLSFGNIVFRFHVLKQSVVTGLIRSPLHCSCR